MSFAMQGSLLDLDDGLTLHELPDGLVRTELGSGAWVELRPAWLTGGDALFDVLHHDVPWHAERREMYDRVVDVPRLLKFYDEDEPLPLSRVRADIPTVLVGAGPAPVEP